MMIPNNDGYDKWLSWLYWKWWWSRSRLMMLLMIVAKWWWSWWLVVRERLLEGSCWLSYLKLVPSLANTLYLILSALSSSSLSSPPSPSSSLGHIHCRQFTHFRPNLFILCAIETRHKLVIWTLNCDKFLYYLKIAQISWAFHTKPFQQKSLKKFRV